MAVSHEHLDHMDLSVLTRLPARTRVLIPRYPSRAFRDRLNYKFEGSGCCQASQSSIRNPGARRNSALLCVTRIMFRATA